LGSLVRLPTVFVAVLLAMLTFMFPAPASAQYVTLTLSLSPSTVATGASVTFTVNGCEVGAAVAFSVDGTSISSTVTGVAGPAAFRRSPQGTPPTCTATGTFTAPATPGTYTARASSVVGGVEQTATAILTVTGAGATTTVPAGALPSTGSDVWRVTASATAVLGIGFAAVLMSRRRRRQPA